MLDSRISCDRLLKYLYKSLARRSQWQFPRLRNETDVRAPSSPDSVQSLEPKLQETLNEDSETRKLRWRLCLWLATEVSCIVIA